MEFSSRGNGRGTLNDGRAQAEPNQTIVFGATEVLWNERIEKFVREMNSALGVDAIRNAVEDKKFNALEVYINEGSIGFLITRIDTLADGSRQFTVLHTLSDVKGRTPLVMIASILLNDLAKKYACKKICCFSDRLGWDGVLKKAGYKYRESIFDKEVI